MVKSILITGGAGFIGSNFIEYFMKKYNNYQLINIDKLTYAGSLNNIEDVLNNIRHIFVKGDICTKELLEDIFSYYDIRDIIHFAAESHVDNSIKNPFSFIHSNIVGTMCLLEAAKNYWMEGPFKYKDGYSDAKFHHISTDEVYGTLGNEGYFNEENTYEPSSIYSASKASSDLLVQSYFKTFGLNTIITNCSNNYGPKQHKEKLIPKIISKCINGESIPIYGNGNNIRDWLYVNDHCEAIDIIFHKGKIGEKYNIGGRQELSNIGIAELICSILDNDVDFAESKKSLSISSFKELITFVPDRPGHDFRYAIDFSKLTLNIGWKPKTYLMDGLLKTIDWYKENR